MPAFRCSSLKHCATDLYIATRTLHAIAVDNKAPQIFKRTSNQGVPFYALGFCALFCSLGYLSVGDGSKVVFGYLTNVVTVFGELALDKRLFSSTDTSIA